MCVVAFFLCLPYAIAHPGIYLLSRYSIWWCCLGERHTHTQHTKRKKTIQLSIGFLYLSNKKNPLDIIFKCIRNFICSHIFFPDLNRSLARKKSCSYNSVHERECVYWWMTQITRIMHDRMRRLELEMQPDGCHWSKLLRSGRWKKKNGTHTTAHKNPWASHQNPPNFRKILNDRFIQFYDQFYAHQWLFEPIHNVNIAMQTLPKSN